MVKETKKFDRERRVQSICFAHFWLVPEGEAGCLLALSGRYKPPTGFCHKPYEVTTEPQSRAPHLLHTGRFTQAHSRVSKVEQKMCSLGEQRTRAPSVHTLSWRIPDEPPGCKVVAEPCKDAGILGLQRRIQSRTSDEAWSLRAIKSDFLCHKVLLKYKGGGESFWHRHQKGVERVPLC